MSYEVEVKYRAVDHDHLSHLLRERGAAAIGIEQQEDTYLTHPSRDFNVTKEAFRIRRLGQENRITYKGPRLEGPTKTREEIEIPFAAGDDQARQLLRVFENLGFRPVAVVRKRREVLRLTHDGHSLDVTLDSADGLGDFAEVEVVAVDASGLPHAQRAVLSLAAQLGLTEVEPRSYLRMVLESRANPPA